LARSLHVFVGALAPCSYPWQQQQQGGRGQIMQPMGVQVQQQVRTKVHASSSLRHSHARRVFFNVVRGYVFTNYVLSFAKPPAEALLRCIAFSATNCSLLCGLCTRQQQPQQMMMQQMPGHGQQVQPQQAQQAQQPPSPQQVLSPQAKQQQQQQQRLQQQQLQVPRVFFSCQPHLVLLRGGARAVKRGECRDETRTGCVAKLLCLCRCSSNKCISSRWAMATITVSQPLLPPLAVLQATVCSPLSLCSKQLFGPNILWCCTPSDAHAVLSLVEKPFCA